MKEGQKNIDHRKLVLYLLEEISAAGRLEVEAWLDESSENRMEYDSLKRTWEETGSFGYFPRDIDVDNIWDKFSEKLEHEETEDSSESIPQPATRNPEPGTRISQPATRKPQPATRTLKFLYAAAAVLFLSWVSLTMIRLIQSDGFIRENVMASTEEVIQDTLSDGTGILLNENSTLRIAKRFDSEERKVELSGEGFFDVKPDSSKPFIVETELGQIKVLGTSFQVKGFPESDLEVFVEEGIVELTGKNENGAGETLKLTKGQRGIVRFPDGELISGDILQPDDLFWVNRKLIFEETKLSLVFKLLRKHYESEIEITEEKILDCLLSATFNDENIDQILAVIAISFDLSIEKDQEGFIVKGKGCENE